METLHCTTLLAMANLKFPVFCCSATLMWRRRTASDCRRPYYYCCFYEAKLCLRKFILLLFIRRCTALHYSAQGGFEVCRLLVESKADVAATRCFSPPPSLHLSLTICLAALAELYSNGPPSTTKTMLLHTCAASVRLNDALLRLLRPSPRSGTVNAIRLRAAAAVWQSPLSQCGKRRRRRR